MQCDGAFPSQNAQQEGCAEPLVHETVPYVLLMGVLHDGHGKGGCRLRHRTLVQKPGSPKEEKCVKENKTCISTTSHTHNNTITSLCFELTYMGPSYKNACICVGKQNIVAIYCLRNYHRFRPSYHQLASKIVRLAAH